jgi:Icc-related predicted phosphoesterase
VRDEPSPGGAARLKVAGIGDLHVCDDDQHPYRELFAEIAGTADVLALCGDLTNLGRPREAEILAEDLRSCAIPVVGVLGNHDWECGHVEEVERILRQAGVHLLDDHTFEAKGVGFAGVKGFGGGFGDQLLGAFGEPAIKAFVNEAVQEAMRLENALRTLSHVERKVVLLHYAPVTGTIEGEPVEIHPFLGSSRLAETIDRYDIALVMHGHAHHGSYEGRTQKGIPVYNCARHVPKPGGRPYALLEV